MFGTRVNPMTIQSGDKVATKFHPDTLQITRSRTVRRVELCAGKPENVHLDGECYDSRFSTVVTPL